MKKYSDIEKWAEIYKDTFVNEAKEVDEAGLSIDDILKKGDQRKADWDAEQKRKEEDRQRQVIKEVWVRDIYDKTTKFQKGHAAAFADLELTYMDGKKVQDHDFDISIIDDDKYQKRIARELRKTRKLVNDKTKVIDLDIQLAMIRMAFPDKRIKWFYGEDKWTSDKWFFDVEAEKMAEEHDEDYGYDYSSERFMEEYRDALMSGSSDPWGDAEIGCGIRSASDIAYSNASPYGDY